MQADIDARVVDRAAEVGHQLDRPSDFEFLEGGGGAEVAVELRQELVGLGSAGVDLPAQVLQRGERGGAPALDGQRAERSYGDGQPVAAVDGRKPRRKRQHVARGKLARGLQVQLRFASRLLEFEAGPTRPHGSRSAAGQAQGEVHMAGQLEEFHAAQPGLDRARPLRGERQRGVAGHRTGGRPHGKVAARTTFAPAS